MPVKYRMALKRSPRRDPQQYRFYRMESESIGARGYVVLTQTAIRKLIRSLCHKYNTKQAGVIFEDIGPWSGEWRSEGVIALNPGRSRARDLITVTHEFVHHLHEHIAPGNDHQNHGPQFVACYMSVLDTARIVPVVGMRAILDSYKIKYNDPGTKNSLTDLRQAVLAPS